MTRDEIDQEFDRFFEFPSRDRGTVTDSIIEQEQEE